MSDRYLKGLNASSICYSDTRVSRAAQAFNLNPALICPHHQTEIAARAAEVQRCLGFDLHADRAATQMWVRARRPPSYWRIYNQKKIQMQHSLIICSKTCSEQSGKRSPAQNVQPVLFPVALSRASWLPFHSTNALGTQLALSLLLQQPLPLKINLAFSPSSPKGYFK